MKTTSEKLFSSMKFQAFWVNSFISASLLFTPVSFANNTVVAPQVLTEIQQFSFARVIIGVKLETSAETESTLIIAPEARGLAARSESSVTDSAERTEQKKQIEQAQELFLKDLQQRINEDNDSDIEGAADTETRRSLSITSTMTSRGTAAQSSNTTDKFTTIPYLVMDKVNAQLLSKIQESPYITKVELDMIVPPLFAWNIALIGADAAWAKGYTGAGQAVAILDTGVDKTHPALQGKVIEEACYSTTSDDSTSLCPDGSSAQVGSGAGIPCDESILGCDHGTHVAGIVAGNGEVVKGVAKDADIIAVQVFSQFSDSSYCGSLPSPCALTYTSDQIKGLERVLELHENGINIAAVNLSLGSGQYQDYCDNSGQGQGALKAIIDLLRTVDIATVIASGNGGYLNAISSPACISSAISVGATDQFDQVAYYSNSANILDLLAPGSDIYSSIPKGDMAVKSGTSMATPAVAGAWAVLKSVKQDSVTKILATLKQSGKPLQDGRNGIIKPRIQVANAIDCLSNECLLDEEGLLGIDVNYQLWQRANLNSPWQPIFNRGWVKNVTVMLDGTILGVGLDNQLWIQASLTSPWQWVPNSGWVKDVTVRQDGAIVGVGMDNQLWIRTTLTSPWQWIPNSGGVIGVTIMPDGSILGIGSDNQLWTRATLTSPWQWVPNSGWVKDIAVMNTGTIVGVGLDNQLWTRATLTSSWQWVPNSGLVIGIAALQ
jgi:subtilisin family serine protease